ncbi:aspartate dehydrogenase [Celeribacter sp.]|uniref:aspartate dehydrogenase n=1 Tax=Celeribacter sp. TaxID=1890673 RepID=UPI003A954540
MEIALIGNGAIAQYAMHELAQRGHRIGALILRPARLKETDAPDGAKLISSASELPKGIDHVLDCAGHSGLAAHGADILRSGTGLTTLSVGALADPSLYDALSKAAQEGSSKLQLVSGAIGALDCLRAARIGQLRRVRYVGRKPPKGWMGSPAEEKLNLTKLEKPQVHFAGTARQAATLYPKNANVAAAVALSGVGFDDTEVELIADPDVTSNIHEIHAEGDFGDLQFTVRGEALKSNPKSSALAAMSAVAAIEQLDSAFVF